MIVQLKDVFGLEAFERIQIGREVSEEFEQAYEDVIHSSSWYRWQKIKSDLFTVVDPNNELEAWFVCNAIKHIDPFQDGETQFSYRNRVDRFFPAMLGVAFAETAERFKGTILGDFCSFVSDPGEELKGRRYGMEYDLLFNNTFG